MTVQIYVSDLAEFLDFHWPVGGGRAEIVRALASALIESDIVAEPYEEDE